MKAYVPRLTAPSKSNKYFLRTTDGGLNKCKYPLPNCVFYAWGRFYEIIGETPKLSRGDAENWWGYTADGYERGKTPKLGAVICWRKGEAFDSSDGYGHVAIVEEIKANGDILVSESHYGGVRWREKIYTKSSGYYLGSAFTFQGFIYPPVDFEQTTETKTETKPQKVIYTKGDYRVTDASVLNVRSGAGVDYPRKKFSQLTKNAREQVYELVRWKANGYVMGVEFTVYEVKDNWGKTPSGWVCLDYCTKI